MFRRLLSILSILFTAVLTTAAVPLARSAADARWATFANDRLTDAIWLAARLPDTGPDEAFRREMRSYAMVYRAGVVVVDIGGEVLETAGSGADLAPHGDVLADALAGRDPLALPTSEQRHSPSYLVAVPLTADGVVVGALMTVTSTEHVKASVGEIRAIIMVLYIVCLTLALLTAHRLARWVLRPLADLETATTAMLRGDLSARTRDVGGPPEVRRLLLVFNRMARRVEVTQERQRTFVADASHQLRNPLGALLLRLERLRAGAASHRDELTAELAEDAVRDGGHLAATLDAMLGLTLCGAEPQGESGCDAAHVCTTALGRWQERARANGSRLRADLPRTAPVIVPETVLAGALDALLDNALTYAAGGLTVVAVRPGDPTTVTVEDDGPGLAEGDVARACDRGWRADPDGPPGTGLGLSVARSLLVEFGGELLLRPSPRSGVSAVLELPSGRPRHGLVDR